MTDFDIKVHEGKTSPPELLTEADLVSLMDEKGIGTDATISEHIHTIFLRGYAEKKGIYIHPTILGESLVKIYQDIGADLF